MKKLTFPGWPNHYVQNVYIIAHAWLMANADMERTPMFMQIQNIRDEAERAYTDRLRQDTSRGGEWS